MPEGPRLTARYAAPSAADGPARLLLKAAGASAGYGTFPLFERLEIGRDEDGRLLSPGLLLLPDPTISYSHCIVTQNAEGRCFVRDVSRNGTRVDGRRVAPNVEVELHVGQTLSVGDDHAFVLTGQPTAVRVAPFTTRGRTTGNPNLTVVTVLVGDIRDYTVLVRTVPSEALQRSVNRVFETLTATVEQHGGTVKEFQGDAILAFWEGNAGGGHAVAACSAAVALDRVVRALATDAANWGMHDFPLRMDWALATGPVSIDSFGGGQTLGLSMIGEPVVLAFRLEKLATDETGPILACPETRRRASRHFSFRDLGAMSVKGFDRPEQVFALEIPPG